MSNQNPSMNEALRLARVFHDCTQSELAKALDVSRSYISEIEAGRKEPSLDLLKRYASYFRVPLSSLLLFSESLGDDNMVRTERFRGVVAEKILSMMRWIELKNSRGGDGKAT